VVALHSVFRRTTPKSQPQQSLKKIPLLYCIIKILVQLGAVCSFLTLLITGFFPLVVLGRTIFGYWLMLHVSAGGVFVCCLVLLALACTEKNLLIKYNIFKGSLFWLILLLSLPLILSIALSMLPIFGTHSQECLLWIHRYCALLFVVLAIMHTYLTILEK
jgi:hypothetical protein